MIRASSDCSIRREDIPVLADHYLRQFFREHSREPQRLARETLAALEVYPWPGNVRELKNAMESIAVFHQGGEVMPADLPSEIRDAVGIVTVEPAPGSESRPPASAPISPTTMADVEREAILAALGRTGGRRAEAAKLLEIGLRTLQRKLKEYKLHGYFEG